MTWSILARDPATSFFGIAIASKFFAVGAPCPWSLGGAGIISTQALVNPELGYKGLKLLESGDDANATLDQLINADEGRHQRQLHVMDWQRRAAAHTGKACIDWCGHTAVRDFSVAGNMLSGPAVIQETIRSYRQAISEDFVERLLLAMEAGEAAGGDQRGKQAAAILIQGPEPFARLSLRVDDHEDPLAELRRLADAAKERSIAFGAVAYPNAAHPHGIHDRDVINTVCERDAGKPLATSVEMPTNDPPPSQ